MERESNATTINDIPDEMLQEIFKYLRTKPDLLENARLVSRKWRTNATFICRRRFVNLSLRSIPDLSKVSKSIFTDSWSVPWSCVTFNGTYRLPSLSEYPLRVFRDFGVHLWRLKSDEYFWGWDDLLYLLRFTPNLRSLVLKSTVDSFPQIPTGLKLPLLKSLKINITADSFDFLHFLLNSSALRLDKLKVKVDLQMVDLEVVKKLMSLLTTFSIATICLKIVNGLENKEEAMSFIAAANLKLRKLTLVFHEPRPDNTTFLTAVGHILASSSQSLRSLKMDCDVGTGECTTALQFPILSALKVLKISFSDIIMETPKEFTGHLFSTVETKNFPVLQKVAMKLRLAGSRADAPGIFKSALCKFETVTELKFEDDDLDVDWIGLFPNIRRLKANVVDDSLSYILKNMQSLEYLELSFYGDPMYSLNLNSILSGVPGAEEVYKENEELIAKHRAVYGRPSLLSFSRLSTFKLKSTCEDGLGHHLRDSGAYLSILPLQPLDELCLTNAELSRECKARLMERHRVVTID